MARMPTRRRGGQRERAEDRRRPRPAAALGYRAFLIGERFMTAAIQGRRSRRCSRRTRCWSRSAASRGPRTPRRPSRPARWRSASCSGRTAPVHRTGTRARDRRHAAAFVTAVGVFVNQPLEFVTECRGSVGLGAVQLHGDEEPAYADGVGRPVIKARRAGQRGPDDQPGRMAAAHHAAARRARSGQPRRHRPPSTGRPRRHCPTRRTILAGGLTPENVAEAVARCARSASTCRRASSGRPASRTTRGIARAVLRHCHATSASRSGSRGATSASSAAVRARDARRAGRGARARVFAARDDAGVPAPSWSAC